ncbi:MAG: type II toxin-antitoxin system prevent-host-death family antitoxin [Armatimonadota bacterium]|nr:type II toxin-antitoxin system prevent-host-death family antitoxin [Armatimonadota bacterium]
MAQQFTLEEAASHLPELVREVRGGQEIVFMDGQQPVARLIPIIRDDPPTPAEIARLSMAGGAFDWLGDEPDLYDDTCGEAIH